MKSSAPAEPGQPVATNLGSVRNGRLTLTNATLNDCIKYAYGIVSDLQIAGPAWIASRDVLFDVVGVAPAGTPPEQQLIMLQNLLSKRVKLTIHHESRQLSFLALVVGKNGARLSEAADESQVQLIPGHIVHNRMSIPVLATLLSRFERRLIQDMTGLEGPFSIKLEWTPDTLRGRVPESGGMLLLNGVAVDPNGPSLVTALQEQLGLRLESRKGPVDVIVVDHAEKVPVEN